MKDLEIISEFVRIIEVDPEEFMGHDFITVTLHLQKHRIRCSPS